MPALWHDISLNGISLQTLFFQEIIEGYVSNEKYIYIKKIVSAYTSKKADLETNTNPS